MRCSWIRWMAGALLGAGAGVAWAEPHVVGFERFDTALSPAERGAVLFSELGCASCHGGSPVAAARRGPNLEHLGSRVAQGWVEAFLEKPEAGRAGSTMPAMFTGIPDEAERREAIASVTAYLGSGTSKLALKAARHVNAERGSALFHERGCVACHAATPDFKPPGGGTGREAWRLAVALPDLQAKTGLLALSDFLRRTSVYRPDGRMPHVALDEQDALDVAAHLLDFQDSDPRQARGLEAWRKPEAAQVERGREWVARLRCASCHEFAGIEPEAVRPIEVAVEPGGAGTCLSAAPGPGLPHYDLTEHQRLALEAFLKAHGSHGAPDEDGKVTLAALNCVAFRARVGMGGPVPEADPYFTGNEGLGDSGRLPPPLTGIGHKLRRDWLEAVLRGDEAVRVRPYVETRMPGYPALATELADWLRKIDSEPDAVPLAQVDDLEAGRKLTGTQGGMNCIICHGWGERASLGIPALEISALHERLEPDWFRSYLLDPSIYRPGTLMPPLWPGGKSAIHEVLDGDAERQIGAIWAFIERGEGIPEGFPERSAGQFELIPADRPLIQRTFLEEVGVRAILVGFPAGIHLAYDGAAGRPARVWRGRFFDAYGTWFSRFAPFEKPLEEDVAAFAEPEGSDGQFLGYELDEKGNPAFLSRQGEREISDHFEAGEGRLTRTIRWKGGTGIPVVGHPEGVMVEQQIDEAAQTWTLIYRWN